MKKTNKKLILLKDDYKLLGSYLHSWQGKSVFDRKNAESLKNELSNAKLVSRDDFPADVVRLNSMIKIKVEEKGETIELMLVTPEKADIKERKISVMAPIGIALIGFRQGQKVNWQVPAGNKTFTILEVFNDMSN